jgi:hypothetical protein
MFRVEEVKLLTARQVVRPQVKFKHLIDNSDGLFVPRLTDKPHALKPLSILVEYDDKEIGSDMYTVMIFAQNLTDISAVEVPSVAQFVSAKPSVTRTFVFSIFVNDFQRRFSLSDSSVQRSDSCNTVLCSR